MDRNIYSFLKKPYQLLKKVYNKIKVGYWVRQEWRVRINDVVICEDNRYIPRTTQAGRVLGDFQVMHNGIKVKKDGYYGSEITKMLRKSRGVHEPQEERVFGDLLKKISPGATMIELGAFWAFYAMWFLKEVEKGTAYLFEADQDNLIVGQQNFKANGLNGDFNRAFISNRVDLTTTPPTLTVDYILKEKKIDFIDILHSDIEGFELQMLEGADETIEQNRIGYFVISTHSNDIHYACLDFLKEKNFIIICEADKLNTYSYDGLIVARSVHYAGIEPVEIAQKQKHPNT
jgi:hypothetical protein